MHRWRKVFVPPTKLWLFFFKETCSYLCHRHKNIGSWLFPISILGLEFSLITNTVLALSWIPSKVSQPRKLYSLMDTKAPATTRTANSQHHLLQHQLYFYYRCYLHHFRQYATLTLHMAYSYTMIHYHDPLPPG